MTDFSIKKLPYDLTSNAGLALAGQYLKRLTIDGAATNFGGSISMSASGSIPVSAQELRQALTQRGGDDQLRG